MTRFFRLAPEVRAKAGSVVTTDPAFSSDNPNIDSMKDVRTDLYAPHVWVRGVLNAEGSPYGTVTLFIVCLRDLEPLSEEEASVVDVMLS